MTDDEIALLGLKAKRVRFRSERYASCRPNGRGTSDATPKRLTLQKPHPKGYQAVRTAAIRSEHGPWCRHCRKRFINRPRGLCWGCYYAPGVKEMYPSTSKYARRGVGNLSGGVPLPLKPTTAAPGTPEKLAVMEARAAAGFAVFHPLDAPGDLS